MRGDYACLFRAVKTATTSFRAMWFLTEATRMKFLPFLSLIILAKYTQTMTNQRQCCVFSWRDECRKCSFQHHGQRFSVLNYDNVTLSHCAEWHYNTSANVLRNLPHPNSNGKPLVPYWCELWRCSNVLPQSFIFPVRQTHIKFAFKWPHWTPDCKMHAITGSVWAAAVAALPSTRPQQTLIITHIPP